MNFTIGKKFKIIIFLVFLLSILISVSMFLLKNYKINYNIQQDLYYKNLQKIKTQKQFNTIIKNTTAKGVLVYDLDNNKILGSKNLDNIYSLASLTKIVTAVAVYEKDKNSLNQIRSMLKTSSNPESEKLAEILGDTEEKQVKYLNNFTQKYNLYFRNVSGLDIVNEENGYRIAGGEGKMMDFMNFIKDYYTKYPELFDQTIVNENNTNTITNDLNFLTFSKTGFTNLSGGNLIVGIQTGLGKDAFILVLNSTEENRFVDVQNIANFLLQSSI